MCEYINLAFNPDPIKAATTVNNLVTTALIQHNALALECTKHVALNAAHTFSHFHNCLNFAIFI